MNEKGKKGTGSVEYNDNRDSQSGSELNRCDE